jgi:hypothetical protein
MVEGMRLAGEEAKDRQQQGERENGAPTGCLASLALIPGCPQQAAGDQRASGGQHEMGRTVERLKISLDTKERMPDEVGNASDQE